MLIPLAALVVSLILFGAFVALAGHNPLDVYAEMYRGAFGTWFSFQNTLQRASPLLLTALCTALPARAGLIVIGGEGAFVVGGLAAAATGVALSGAAPLVVLSAMFICRGARGRRCGSARCGYLRVRRGVNETISSLLLTYIGIALLNHFVEGPLKDPESLNKPSTRHIGEANMIGAHPGARRALGPGRGRRRVRRRVRADAAHGVRLFGVDRRRQRARGAAFRRARGARVVIITCALAGAAAGIAGTFEVAAVHGRANASLVAGYGYAGILVAFLARHNGLAIIPVALFLGGICGERRAPAARLLAAGRDRRRAAGHSVRGADRERHALRPHPLAREQGGGLMATETLGIWGIPLAMIGGAIRVSTPFLVREPRRVHHRAERTRESRARGHARDGRDVRLRGLVPQRLAVARRARGGRHRRRYSGRFTGFSAASGA